MQYNLRKKPSDDILIKELKQLYQDKIKPNFKRINYVLSQSTLELKDFEFPPKLTYTQKLNGVIAQLKEYGQDNLIMKKQNLQKIGVAEDQLQPQNDVQYIEQEDEEEEEKIQTKDDYEDDEEDDNQSQIKETKRPDNQSQIKESQLEKLLQAQAFKERKDQITQDRPSIHQHFKIRSLSSKRRSQYSKNSVDFFSAEAQSEKAQSEKPLIIKQLRKPSNIQEVNADILKLNRDFPRRKTEQQRKLYTDEFNKIMQKHEIQYESKNAPQVKKYKLKPQVSVKLSEHNKPEKEFKVCAQSVFRLRNIN